MEVVGQFNNAFIIGQLDSDLFILDQHASDEKYNYEQLQSTTTFKVQPMIHPLQLELTAMDELVVMDNLDIFRANGFDFTIDHDAPPTRRIRLSSYFFSKGTEFGMSDVMELVSLLRDRPGEMVRIPRINSMIASRACRKSIMFGTPLKMAEMNAVRFFFFGFFLG
jgi:DNA mismatch repair protein PMS2